MNLKDLLPLLTITQVWGNTDVEFFDIGVDSRVVKAGDLFVAIKGEVVDANQYVGDVVGKGAVVILSQLPLPESMKDWNGVWVQVDDDRKALSFVAEAFFDFPSSKIKLVGVTGTNGKSTVVSLLYQLFTDLGYKVGLFSTIENRIYNKVLPSKLTTPDPISLSRYLAEMVEVGCDFAFMEVSSHALSQQRCAALQFEGGVFMNISHDHLDYHQTFQNYIYAKKIFFDQLSASAFALVNMDDSRSPIMLQNCKAKKASFGLQRIVDYKVQILEEDINAMLLSINQQQFYTSIAGRFNAYNLAAVYGVADLMGMESSEVLRLISNLQGVKGRLQKVKVGDQLPIGVVDYAHTPDAVEKVCQALNAMLTNDGRLLVVVGCGGDRDKTKRPIMARIAASNSSICILTSDNPRTESPEDILLEMAEGLNPVLKAKTFSIVNRKEAIRMAVAMANVNDVILVAGKGHENYQIIGNEVLPFDDAEILTYALQNKYIKA
ncbi:UDP-N-acetylmuramoyl-L-alanyl-D-glutamate--2,6-diaminopimelate ligase [Membranihabitans marinus]|uniref:UDP-N-acetylmuramoyl-L-alanyl-D-glutamate--2, 6-diaminopimelate ligase n=1 Tax=Membranihabitans marinus TaxID=1227546 RepID=UPI001F02D27F|nr:UDP-N-acetylmuramoyl-L-alanyl-D-glutamate--2,6-diaminopimelate ligase [Membranihabitans marinus]